MEILRLILDAVLAFFAFDYGKKTEKNKKANNENSKLKKYEKINNEDVSNDDVYSRNKWLQ